MLSNVINNQFLKQLVTQSRMVHILRLPSFRTFSEKKKQFRMNEVSIKLYVYEYLQVKKLQIVLAGC